VLESSNMAVPKAIHQAKGLWRGKSQLNLPFLPPDKRVSTSDSRLHIDSDEQNSFATITYDWHQDGKRQEGTIIMCKAAKSKAVELGWVDSWHQNGAVMHFSGEESEDGLVKTKGTYGPEKEPWGWTIEFQLSADQLTMNMTNIHPTGQVDWAVKATYKKK